MTIKSKRIHLIETDPNRLTLLEKQDWESGSWNLIEAKAKQLVGGSILFHKKKREPSFFGGVILNYRIQDKAVLKGQVIFKFQYLADHRNVATDNKGWSGDMKVVLK